MDFALGIDIFKSFAVKQITLVTCDAALDRTWEITVEKEWKINLVSLIEKFLS